MSIRTRITVVAAAAVAGVALLLTGVSVWAEVRDLRGQVDIDLRERASAIAAELVDSGEVRGLAPPPFGSAIAYAQVVIGSGQVISLAPDTPQLPVDQQTLDVAAGTADRFYSSEDVDTVHLRMLTVPLRPGSALQVARPVDEIDLHLIHFAGIMGVVALAGLGLAIVLGRLVASSALRPVERLTEAAEKVAATRDLAHRIDVRGDTELDRLAESINSMVAAVDTAVRTQNQLVIDASHELQTPLTVLRTNIELMQRVPDLSEQERGRVLADLRLETENLSHMANNLIDLARGASDPRDRQIIDVEEVVGDVVYWAQRRYPDVRFTGVVDPYEIRADPDQLHQMLRNLVENAATWTPPGSEVEITLDGDALTVRDHGPGIDPSDLPWVFKRFYRAAAARSLPGAGLGLAVVEKVALDHGWNLSVENADDGGTIVSVDFATDLAASDDESFLGYRRA